MNQTNGSHSLTSLLKAALLATAAILGLYVSNLVYGLGVFIALQQATGYPPLGYVYGMPGGLNPFIYGPVVTLPLTILATLWAVSRKSDGTNRPHWYHAPVLIVISLLLGAALAGGMWQFTQIQTGNAISVDPVGDIIYASSTAFGFSPLVAITAFPLNVLLIPFAWYSVEMFERVVRTLLSLSDFD